MKLCDLFEEEGYNIDDAMTCDGNSGANEIGNLARRDSKENLSTTGRGTNYEKAKRIIGGAKLAKKDSIIVRDDTTEQHGQNFTTSNARR
jgi:hypothetical protein